MKEKHIYISDLISAVLPIAVIVSILFVAFSTPLSYLISPGSTSEARILVIRCIKVLAVLPPIIAVSSIALAVLRYKKSLYTPVFRAC